MNNVNSLRMELWHFTASAQFTGSRLRPRAGCFLICIRRSTFWQRLFIQRERCIFETIENVFVKLKLNSFFLGLILAIFPKQGIKEGINLKFGLP